MAYQMQFAPVLARSGELWDGALATLVLSAESITVGVTIGLAAAIARTEGPRWLDRSVEVYVELFRNTPLLVQLFLVFFGLPLAGLRLSANTAALLAVSLNLGAYATEIFRAGILSIPRGQIEAGRALALSRVQVLRFIVLVPALRVIYPALTGQLTLTLLGTSIASAISATELTAAGSKIESVTVRSFETFLSVGAIYVLMTFAFRLVYWLIGLWLFRESRPPAPSPVADFQPVGRPA